MKDKHITRRQVYRKAKHIIIRYVATRYHSLTASLHFSGLHFTSLHFTSLHFPVCILYLPGYEMCYFPHVTHMVQNVFFFLHHLVVPLPYST
jgi:hypothetical protein